MSNCSKGCGKRLNLKTKITCKICNKDFHNGCVGISENDTAAYNTGDAIYLCDCCKKKAVNDLQTSNDTTGTSNNPTIADVFSTVTQILAEQKSFMATLEKHNKEISELKLENKIQQEDINENKNKICVLENSVSDILTESAHLKASIEEIKISNQHSVEYESSINSLKEENTKLRVRLNESEKMANANCLEIIGVPEPRGENLIVTLQLVCAALGFKLDPAMVDNCYRLRYTDDPLHSKIIVKFLRKCHKEELINCRKIKRDFSTSFLDNSLSCLVNTPQKIYVNELLTSYNKILLKKAKEYKSNNNIKYLWIKNGNIYLRKSETSRAVLLKNYQSFNDV